MLRYTVRVEIRVTLRADQKFRSFRFEMDETELALSCNWIRSSGGINSTGRKCIHREETRPVI